MPIAAVPTYLGDDFKDASPGLRFGMYLKLWGVNCRSGARLWTTHDIDYEVRGQNREEREVKKENKVSALAAATQLTLAHRDAQKRLIARQSAASATIAEPALLRLDATAVAPFTTGLGNEHPLENGFAFLNPYGLPYLPGSGVKGVLRQAARELASGAWGGTQGWSKDRSYALRLNPQTTISLSAIDVLFGLESANGSTDHVRGALTFWDVIPQIAGESLLVEIMTPHQSHYYQQTRERKSGDSTTPHDSGQPNPISFLTVPPGSGFTFIVTCDQRHLERLAPDLAAAGEDGQPRWKALMRAAFEHAFEWLGFGAKTAVGYGAMQRDLNAEQDALKAREEAKKKQKGAAEERACAAARAAMTEGQRMVHDFECAMKKLPQRKQPISGSNYQAIKKFADAMLASNFPPEEKHLAADAIERWADKLLSVDKKELRKKLKLAELRGGS
jgi:CRISPR-associated protein Cmr6